MEEEEEKERKKIHLIELKNCHQQKQVLEAQSLPSADTFPSRLLTHFPESFQDVFAGRGVGRSRLEWEVFDTNDQATQCRMNAQESRHRLLYQHPYAPPTPGIPILGERKRSDKR